jgi:glucan 1,3-beta-glucosidase
MALCQWTSIPVSLWTHTYTKCSKIRCVYHLCPLTHSVGTRSWTPLAPQTISLDEAGHIRSACGNAGPLSDFDKSQLTTIVGEWTPAMTDCAKYLNGRFAGARYDGSISPGAPVYGSCNGQTGSGATFSQGYKNFLRQSWEAQVS